MDKEKLRNLMLQNRNFLALLYNSNSLQAKKELATATNVQIRLILTLLHHCASGSIPVPKDNFEILKKSRKVGFLEKRFYSKVAINKLLRSTRKDQLNALFKVIDFTILLCRFLKIIYQ